MRKRRSEDWDKREKWNELRALPDEEFYIRIITEQQIGDEAQDEEHRRLKKPIRCLCCNHVFRGGIYTRRDVAKACMAGDLVLETEFSQPTYEKRKDERGKEFTVKKFHTIGHFPVCWNCHNKRREERKREEEEGQEEGHVSHAAV